MVNEACVRGEYPRPSLVREDWLCLNGEWDFEIDNGINGRYKDYMGKARLNSKIIVPFCPESRLSGVAHTDFMRCVWYKRVVDIPEKWAGKNVILHIGASDWDTTVYAGGKKVARHIGCFTPFSVDITENIENSKCTIAIEALDNVEMGRQPVGKQSFDKYESHGCYYTRTTGIWQTVWLEAVEKAHIVNYNVHTDIDNPTATLMVKTSGAAHGKCLSATVSYEGRVVGGAKCVISSETSTLAVPLIEKHLWEIGNGRLYDVTFEISEDSGRVYDTVYAYFGLRTVAMNKEGFFLNGEYVFGRFVLDQGFYPDGIWTAPSDEALKQDIIDSMAVGFNGARLHQKIFEPRFLYYADKLGYMIWDELGNWGWDHTDPANIYTFLPEWLEVMERDMAHPSLIGWCPLNETWDKQGRRQSDKMLRLIYDITCKIDPTRPVIISSGTFPIYDLSGNMLGAANDVHDYAQEPELLASVFDEIDKGIIKDQLFRRYGGKGRVKYDTSKSLFVSEYGGIGWNEDGDGWGYGKAVGSKEELLSRLESLTAILRENPECCAMCYTQLYDVEQEKNGLMTYDRRFKFPKEALFEIFSKKSVKERK